MGSAAVLMYEPCFPVTQREDLTMSSLWSLHGLTLIMYSSVLTGHFFELVNHEILIRVFRTL